MPVFIFNKISINQKVSLIPMKRKTKFWILVAIVAVLCTACSTDNSSGQGQGDATKPPPQVRVETLPTATALPLPTETVIVPTPEPTAAQAFFWSPPDSNALEDQINAMMDEMDRKLKSQNTTIKP
jgi:hypothetical protein